MEKIGLLEDINKGNSNPDVGQRGRVGQRSAPNLMVRVGRKARGENCQESKSLKQ